MKVTASGFAHKKTEYGTQESEQKSILAIYTTQLPTLITKVLNGNGNIVQCFARGSGTKRNEVINQYHIGVKIENKQQVVFSMNFREKKHKCFVPPDQKELLNTLNENGIIEPQVEEITLRFQCSELVKELNEYAEAGLHSNSFFRGKFSAAFCRSTIDRERVLEHIENERAIRHERKKIRKLQLRELIDYNQINSLPSGNLQYWVKYSKDCWEEIDSPHEFVAPIKRLFNTWAGCEFYKQGKKNQLILVDVR